MTRDPTTEAEGFADLELWQDAWDALDELPPETRATPEALRLRLRCCPPLNAWEIGENIAGLLQDGGDSDRIQASQFFHALALHQIGNRRLDPAREAIAQAITIWPDHRETILNDPALETVIFGKDHE